MSFQDVLYPFCSGLNIAIAASRIPMVIRRRRDVKSLAFVGSFLALSMTFGLATPAIWARVDALAGAPNVAGVLSQCLVVVYTFCIQLVLINWLDPETAHRRVRWRLVLAVVAIAAMVALFLQADIGREETRGWMADVASIPLMGIYMVIYLTTFLIGRIDVIRLCVSYGPAAGRLWLRRGLYWTAVGSMFGVVYVMARLADVLAPQAGLDPARWETAAGLSTVACALLTMTGLTMPSWGPVLSRVTEWIHRYFEFRALHPLWRRLTNQFPAVRLTDIVPAGPPLLCRPRDLRLWLGRMKTEIRDAQIALGRARHATVLATAARADAAAAGYHGDDLEGVVQAALIEYGLEEAARGELTGPGIAEQLHGGADVIAEVRFLIAVSHARRLPIVGGIVARFRAKHPVPTS
ncbi:MAB_1171c family putative transporter [Actinoplanes sp. L3-i22]|uniref:MAB_1171c family putative transporter n=1 Tax=Actinoplanes sp. L3-i22 TaxID=2836373 RepID=UPI001C768CED|nr:MAB_1171c family putative transporter [Actinoplanes sp. L3-i22]BCY13434.1 hypothetical protein L3i22_085220 [Actinoplanes sp. L3-i22]